MNKPLFVALILPCLLCMVAMAQSTTQPDRGGRDKRGPRDGVPQNIEGAMKGANRAMRQLRRQLADASRKDDNLKLIGDMQRNIVIAKGMPLPDDVREDVKGADRGKLQNDYRADLIAVVRKLLDLEQSVVDDKLDIAKTQLDEIQKLRDAAHDKLGVHDDEKGK